MKLRLVISGHSLALPRQYLFFNFLAREYGKIKVSLVVPRNWPVTTREKILQQSPCATVGLPDVRLRACCLAPKQEYYIMPMLPLDIIDCNADVAYSISEPWSMNSLMTLMGAKACGALHINYTFENMYKQFNFCLDAIQKMVLRHCSFIFASSFGTKEVIIRRGFPDANVFVMPLVGIDVEKFSPQIKGKLRFEMGWEDKIVIGYVGRLSQEKGTHLLLETFDHLRRKYKERVCLLLCGAISTKNLDYYKALRSLIGKLENDSNFAYLGFKPYEALPEIYRSIDIFVHPSIPTRTTMEQFGFAITEAMASALPIVASKLGAIPEIVREAGTLVTPGNTKEIANAIDCLIKNDNLRMQYAAKARERAEKCYSMPAVASQFVEYLHRML